MCFHAAATTCNLLLNPFLEVKKPLFEKNNSSIYPAFKQRLVFMNGGYSLSLYETKNMATLNAKKWIWLYKMTFYY